MVVGEDTTLVINGRWHAGVTFSDRLCSPAWLADPDNCVPVHAVNRPGSTAGESVWTVLSELIT
ncbi:hypothetical protein AB0N14_36075 [Streptomyces sp. NPDC051104]|uniref:hypothetical protein n=1 Tax=Streptomyces sp. NPDC051104 TaxID=3155044 RepID=UPI0034466CE0